MLLKFLYAYFMSKVGVTSIIADRLRPAGICQDDPTPAADMRITSSSHDHYLGGLSGPVTSSVTIDCYADDPEDADALAAAMMYSGIVGHRSQGDWGAFQGGTLEESMPEAFDHQEGDAVIVNSVRLSGGPYQSIEGVDPGTDERRYVTSFTLSIVYSRACR